MKKVLFVLSLCVFILVACQSTEVEPPSLTVSNHQSSVNAWRGTHSWTYLQLGKAVSVNADSPSPIDVKEDLPIIDILPDTRSSINASQIRLDFTSNPNDVKVKIYDFDTEEEKGEVAISEFNDSGIEYAFIAPEDKSIYEVIAAWEQWGNESTVHYAFVINNCHFTIPDNVEVNILLH